MENGSDEDPFVKAKLYVGDVGAQAKPSTTGAEYGYRGCFSSRRGGSLRNVVCDRFLKKAACWRRVENAAISPDCNSFNAKYSKKGILERSEENSTGAKCGFTLAEVLITLSIIGVVAALTIPSLVVKNQEKQTVVQLKKAYNVLSNAYSLAQTEYGGAANFGWDADGYLSGTLLSSKAVMDRITPFLNTIRRCDGTKGCYPAGVAYTSYDGRGNNKR